VWLIKTGRGWGKNRTGAETIRRWIESGQCRRLNLVASTAADARDTMVEGESGILATSPPWFRPTYEPSKRRLTWPNGAMATLYSSEKPDRLRGPQCDSWWADEMATWKYLRETWDNLQMGARLGRRVRGIVTTTPRPLRLMKELMADPHVHVTSGHTFENKANLNAQQLAAWELKYGGTRLGRQELAGEILDDNPDALWQRDQIERDRVIKVPDGVELCRVVVAVDPTCTAGGDEAGIITAALGSDGHYYVISDDSMHGSPDAWASAAITAYHRSRADRIVYESNQGGDMVKNTLLTVDNSVPVKDVWASRGKVLRAEPISALSEQGRVHHVGAFPTLEDEQCEWTAGDPESPNRLDAMVYALTYLHVGPRVPETEYGAAQLVSVAGFDDVLPDFGC
jgi:phage terminase large subunit-like protein